MASIPLPALGIQSQQQDPLAAYSKILGLKQMLAMQPLQQQQEQQNVQAGALDIAQKQRQAQYEQNIQNLPSNPSDDDILKAGGPIYGPAILKSRLDIQKTKSDIQKATDEHQTSMQDHIGNVANAIKEGGYDPQKADTLLAGEMSNPDPVYVARVQQLRQGIQQNPAGLKPLVDQILAQSGAQQKASTEKEAADARMLAAGNNPTALAARAAKGDPDAIATFNKLKQQEIEKATGVAQAEQPIKAATAGAEASARLGVENSPQAIQGAVSKATAVQKALASQSNAALQNVPPHLVAPATAEATKAGEDFAQSQQSADDMKSMIDLSKSGNKEASAYAPVPGVMEINVAGQTKRVNMAEIDKYGGAGSAWDRVKGWVGKQTKGQPIPANILDDMQTVSDAYSKNSQTMYQRKLDVINHNYGSKFTAPGALPSGNGQVIDKDTAMKFYQAAGGDPIKARKMAQDAGWKPQ